MKSTTGIKTTNDNHEPATLNTERPGLSSLQYLPVSLFGSTVAFAGASIGWRQAGILFGVPSIVSNAIGIFAWSAFIILLVAYLYKFAAYKEKVIKELTDPIAANFLGTFFISAVLLSTVAAPFILDLARVTWLAGTAGGIVYMYLLTKRLYKGELNVLDLVPPVLIPGLTVLNAVFTRVNLKFSWWELPGDMPLFAIGIVFVMVFFVIISYRLVHLEPPILFLKPTLLLMSAPFEVGFLAYVSTKTQVDELGSILFFFGFFIFIIAFFIVFTRDLPFMTSWWGACFSMGALANASLKYALLSHMVTMKYLSLILLSGSGLLTTVTLYLTLHALFTGKLLKA
jgi:tellurite resistance protein